jgi:hypothetical protein
MDSFLHANVQLDIKDSPKTLPFCYICLSSIDKICQYERIVLCDKCYKKVNKMIEDV